MHQTHTAKYIHCTHFFSYHTLAIAYTHKVWALSRTSSLLVNPVASVRVRKKIAHCTYDVLQESRAQFLRAAKHQNLLSMKFLPR